MSGFECWFTHFGSEVLDGVDDDLKSVIKSFGKYSWEAAKAEGVQSGAYLEGYEVGYKSGWRHQQALDAQLCESMDVCDGYGKMFADAIRNRGKND